MSYATITHVAGAVDVATSVTGVCFIVHALSGLRSYRAEQLRKSPTTASLSLRNLPLLLRILYALTAVFSIGGGIGIMVNNWGHVSVDVMQDDPIHPTSKLDLDSATQLCIAAGKYCPMNYVIMKLCCYLFYFIKQRTVRTMQPRMNLFEKLVLQATLGMLPLLAIGSWLLQGDRSTLDGTCLLYIQPFLALIMGVADLNLASAYLYLFIQPLRETIEANRRATQRAQLGEMQTIPRPSEVTTIRVAPAAAATSTAQPSVDGTAEAGVVTPTTIAVSPTAAAAPTSPTAAAAATAAVPAGNGSGRAAFPSLALELVMRRNTYACILVVCSATCNISWITISMFLNEQSMRKFMGPVALLDTQCMLASLAWVLSGSPKSNAVAPEAGGTKAHRSQMYRDLDSTQQITQVKGQEGE